MKIENIIDNIIDKHMFCEWQKYDLRKFIDSVVKDTIVLRELEGTFRFRHDTNWNDRFRYDDRLKKVK